MSGGRPAASRRSLRAIVLGTDAVAARISLRIQTDTTVPRSSLRTIGTVDTVSIALHLIGSADCASPHAQGGRQRLCLQWRTDGDGRSQVTDVLAMSDSPLILIIFKKQVLVISLMRKKSNTRASTLLSRKRRDAKGLKLSSHNYPGSTLTTVTLVRLSPPPVIPEND